MALTKNLVIDQGSTFTAGLVLTDALNLPLNLTGYQFRSQMRKNYASSSFVAFTIEPTNLAAGEITLKLTSAQTALLKSGRYVYDVEIVKDNEVTRVIEGIITVTPEVSR